MIPTRDVGQAGLGSMPCVLALSTCLLAGSALAQPEAMRTAPPAALAAAPAAAAPTETPPSEIMVVNLIRLLVKQGVITQQAADGLVAQAQAEAQQAKAAAAASAPAQALLAPPPPGVIRVPYVPQVVRDQIRDDVKKDVMAQAQAEGWASPHALPDWLGKVEFFGDFRFRDEFDFYSSNNVSQFINYNAFNANGPIDINANTNPNGLPFLNTRTNRTDYLSVRARFGVKFEPADWVNLTFRLASGNDTAPVSDTQLLGGGLTKKNIWLDQGYLTLKPVSWARLDLGRVPDLFMHTDLLFDENLNFDGVLASGERAVGDDGLRVFGAGGVFPLGYVSNTFPTNDSNKAPESSKWLFAAQAGVKYQPHENGWSARAAVSFYDFDNVQGQYSAPCDTYAGVKQCSTDSSAPAYMQKGNTLFLIRNIAANPSSPENYAQPQLVGLSYNYRELDVMAELEAPVRGDIRAQITGDYVRNLSYDPARILASQTLLPVTNYNTAVNGGLGAYQSGNNAFNIRATVGYLNPSARGNWNFQIGYKYIEPDAVIDAFNNNDFHMGGTNAKGYYIVANYFVAHNTWVDVKWFSANEVYGPPLAIDVLYLEMQTRF